MPLSRQTKGRCNHLVNYLLSPHVEAFINNICKYKLTGFYRENLDTLNLRAKWVVVTRLAYGSGIDPNDDLIARIDRIQTMRNFLVHARPIHFQISDLSSGKDPALKFRIGVERAEQAVNTCLDAVERIRTLDSGFEASDYEFFITRHAERLAEEFQGGKAFSSWWASVPPESPAGWFVGIIISGAMPSGANNHLAPKSIGSRLRSEVSRTASCSLH